MSLSGIWRKITLSYTGQYQLAITFDPDNLFANGFVYVSSDYGNTWTNPDGSLYGNWQGASMSSDGQYQSIVSSIVGLQDGNIYVSSDYGLTWIKSPAPNRYWNSIKMSENGQYQTAVSSKDETGTVGTGQIYVSFNYGSTWTQKGAAGNWNTINVSNNGYYQTATANPGIIYISTDYGNTWIASSQNTSKQWIGLSMSGDGRYQSAITYDTNGQLYISSDYGSTWTQKLTTGYWKVINVSSTGQYQIASKSDENVYISSNYGSTWTVVSSLPHMIWSDVMFSGSGQYQMIASNDNAGLVYVSFNYGVDWVKPLGISPSQISWNGVGISFSGQYQTVGLVNGRIYKSNNYGITLTVANQPPQWFGISPSTTAQYQIATTVDEDYGTGNVYTTNNYGATWKIIDGNLFGNWGSSSISSSGQYQTIASRAYYDAQANTVYGKIYVSNDFGATWTYPSSLPTAAWISARMSADGKYQTAISYTDNTGVSSSGFIYVSGDFGVTWSKKGTTNKWSTLAVSYTGQYQTISANPGSIYYSTDYGNTWTISSQNTSQNWVSISISSTNGSNDGKYQIATYPGSGGNGAMFVSSDYGATWTQKLSTGRWGVTRISSTGQYQIAAISGGIIYTSSDYGSTWATPASGPPANNWGSCRMSGSGQYQILSASTDATSIVGTGSIYLSSDYGNTWAKPSDIAQGSWGPLSISFDGQYQAVGKLNNAIYRSINYGGTWSITSDYPTLAGVLNDGQAMLVPVFSSQYSGSINKNIGSVTSGQVYTQSISNTTSYILTTTNSTGSVTAVTNVVVPMTQILEPNQQFNIVNNQTVFTPILPVVIQGGTIDKSYTITGYPSNTPYPQLTMSGTTGVVTISSVNGASPGSYTYSVRVEDSQIPAQIINTSFSIIVLGGQAPNVSQIILTGANYNDLTPYEKAYVVNSVAQQIIDQNPTAIVLYINLSNGSVIADVGTNIPVIIPNITITIDDITLTNIVCLLETSNIMLADGTYKNVKDIQEGDVVRSALNGANVRVLYCGSTLISDLTKVENTNQPYRIPVNFFGENHPSKDVLISGHHRVFFTMDENIVGIQVFKLLADIEPLTMEEALLAINNTTLRYYHIGVEGGKNAVFCEGIPVETLDEGEW